MSVNSKRPLLMPESTPDFMAPAWASCLQWAIGMTEIREAFAKETGHRWTPARSGIDAMIDEATGADRAYVEAFVAWFNVAVWGNVVEDNGDGE